jgi:hypothetical protein
MTGVMAGAVTLLTPMVAYAAEASDNGRLVEKGVSGLWVLANVSFAGMRAQNHPSAVWRTVAFIFGFPGTFVSFISVQEGSYRAYGVMLPPGPLQR